GRGRNLQVRRSADDPVRGSTRAHERGQDRQEASPQALHPRRGMIASASTCAGRREPISREDEMNDLTMANMKDRAGSELGVSRWLLVDQERIDRFAECTEDRQWIHVDVERAKRESPFKRPIAHGYLTLSLVGSLSIDVGVVPSDAGAGFNYGLDKARFLAPVPAGARVRLCVSLDGVEEKSDGQLLVRTKNVLEIENSDKPALIADALALLIPASKTS